MTRAEALAVIRSAPTAPVPTVATVLGVSSWAAYGAIRAGEFPVPVVHVGRRIVVPTTPVRRLLGIEDG